LPKFASVAYTRHIHSLRGMTVPKFTYPIVFIYNEEVGMYNGYIPDLGVAALGDKLEDAYADAESSIKKYFQIVMQEDLEIPVPSPLETVTAKWVGYKTSLITADLPDAKKKKS